MAMSGNLEPIGRKFDAGAPALTSADLIRADAVSMPIYAQLQDAAKDVAELTAFGRITSVNARIGGEAITTQGLLVSGDFFRVLGVRLALGRGVEAANDQAGATPVVVVSHAWWQQYYGGEISALGRTLTLNDTTFTIIGVAPSDFMGPHPGDSTDFFVPLSSAALLDPVYGRPINGQDFWWVEVIARLKPGASSGSLLGATSGVFAAAAKPVMKEGALQVRDGRTGLDWAREGYRRPLHLLLAVVGLVMLVTCSNLAGLCLARGEARRHEFAVRAALGSGRERLLRAALLENTVLALMGAGLGIGLAGLGRNALSALAAGTSEGLRYDTGIDLRVLGFSVAVALLTAVLSGMLPGWRAAQVDPVDALKRGNGATPRMALAGSLVVLQIALALTVMVGAGLYGRSLLSLLHTDPGYRLDNRLAFRTKAKASATMGQRNDFHRHIKEALLRVPGVEAATVANFKPMMGSGIRQSFFTLPGLTPESETSAVRFSVDESFFAVMDMPLIEGRGFRSSDQDGLGKGISAVVVNEAFVREYLMAGVSVDRTLKLNGTSEEARVIGVVRDAHLSSVKGAVPPTVFFYSGQRPILSAYHIVRSSLPKTTLLAAAREAVASVDPEVPLGGPAMLDEVRDKALREEHLMATLVGSLGVLALGLGCLGVYGLMAFVVVRRTRDIGVRMALGAKPVDIGRAVLRGALRLTFVGGVIGMGAALALGRLVENQLYGVTARDPLTFVTAIGVLLAGMIAVALVPAWRATQVNPLEALRAE